MFFSKSNWFPVHGFNEQKFKTKNRKERIEWKKEKENKKIRRKMRFIGG